MRRKIIKELEDYIALLEERAEGGYNSIYNCGYPVEFTGRCFLIRTPISEALWKCEWERVFPILPVDKIEEALKNTPHFLAKLGNQGILVGTVTKEVYLTVAAAEFLAGAIILNKKVSSRVRQKLLEIPHVANVVGNFNDALLEFKDKYGIIRFNEVIHLNRERFEKQLEILWRVIEEI